MSPTGRITPGCAGLWTDEQAADWKLVCDFVHTQTSAKIGVQLGHSGPKGSTKLMWEGIDEPLESGNWEVVAPSPVSYRPGVNQVPRELIRADMDEICEQFVAAAVRADETGFDLLELHSAHGYLLSSFISPVTNHRTDEYGGSVENRLRYPLEVFGAIRAAWRARSKPPGPPRSTSRRARSPRGKSRRSAAPTRRPMPTRSATRSTSRPSQSA